MSINDKQDKILTDFEEIGDPFDQYAYLIELSSQLPAMPEKYKTDANSVAGCQSTVWLHMSAQNGVLTFEADSNTFIMKGILYLLQTVLCGERCEDVAGADVYFLKEASITGTFESARNKGIGYIVRDLKEFCSQSI